ncbi:MAG: lipopolysaccharide heptosyltransferase II [Chlamydiales bacterium]|nr:lipopolysaccharide heptosyltransferase II [Chlamydiales bacterium]
MPNWIGDLVMATPVLADLKEAYPEAEITAMCKRPMGELLEKDPHVDQIFSFDKPSTLWRRFRHRSVIEKLRQGNYDLGVLLTNSFSSAWWFWQGRVKWRIGYKASGRGFLLTEGKVYPKQRSFQHLVKTYRALLGAEGERSPKLYLSEEEKAGAWKLLERFDVKPGDCLIGINPGAAYGEAKCWLPERFAEVAKNLLEDARCKIVFFGDAGSKATVNAICKDLPERAINLAGLTTLRELMAIISLLRVFLTNDSGPMHIAAALGCRVVALFGSTDPVVTGPYLTGKVIRKDVACSPCFKRKCPIDFRCMKRIECEEVIKAIKDKLWD